MRAASRRTKWGLAVAVLAAVFWSLNPCEPLAQAASQPAAKSVYRSPLDLAVSRDGKTLYVSDRTAGCIAVLDLVQNKKIIDIPVNGDPRGVALAADGGTLYVAEHNAGTVAVIDTKKGQVTSRLRVGLRPVALALADKSKRLYVCNRDSRSVSVVDLGQGGTGQEIGRVAVIREPSYAAVTPDETQVVVANLLPHGASTDPALAAEVSIIDSAKLTQRATVKLPAGSTAVSGVCISPDGKWAYVVHVLGRFNVPFSQLDRGWIHTHALSIIDLAKASRLATVLLDELARGAADPHAVVCSGDGQSLWISHAGIHTVSLVAVGRLHELLQGKLPPEVASRLDGGRPNVWVRINQDRQVIAELANDLTALSIAGVIRRAASGGNNPRGLALSPDGQRLYVANYYSGSVGVLESQSGTLLGNLAVGPQPEADAARRGEVLFHDATFCFQGWHSCATCHPNDGRVDGLRWDFLRDGLGNAKDTPSLVFVDQTEPLNRRAMFGRETVHDGARTGLVVAHLTEPRPGEIEALVAYFKSLRPEASPYLAAGGKFSEAAARGKALFDGKANCNGCHPAPWFTDRKMHNIGTASNGEHDGRYDTPSLVDAYQTAPYLHDGRAPTIKNVLTNHDPTGRHGKVKGLSVQELDDLVAYVLSL